MQIDWWTLAFQTVNFLIVVWLLSRFLYQPIKRVIEEREAADRKAAKDAEDKVRASDEARKAYEAKLSELAQKQREEEARLHAEMEDERRKMMEAAEQKAQRLVAEAQERIERERTEALDDLGKQIVALAAEMARKAIGEGAISGDPLLQEVTNHLDALPESDLAELSGDLAGQGRQLTVVTAAPLSESDQTRWHDAVAARLDGADVDFVTEPELLGGAELRFPHAVISLSVANRLERAAQAVKAS